MRKEKYLGDAHVIGINFAVVHANQLDSTDLTGLRVELYQAEGGPAKYNIIHIYHPICQNIKECVPNVALLRTSGTLPIIGRVSELVQRSLVPAQIHWASGELLQIMIRDG